MKKSSVVCLLLRRYVYNTYTNTFTNAKHTIQIYRKLRCSGTNRLLISDFSSSTGGERQFLKVFPNPTMLTPPQHLAHLVVF